MNSYEPFVNTDLINKIRRIREKTFDETDINYDETNREEERHLSELYRVACNYDERELAICVVAALEKNADIVYKTLSEDRTSLKKGRKE